MIESKLQIINRLGLHARAAAKLVHTAAAFESQVTLIKGDEEVDAKSILGILQLGAPQGSQVSIRCEGKDQEAALAAVTELIAGRFGEDD